MWSELPTELAVEILETAARELVVSNRPRAVELALTSKYVYGLVAPILYREMVVTDDNCERIRALLREGAGNVFPSVRRFFIAPDVAYHTPRFDESALYPYLASATHVAGSGAFVTGLANHNAKTFRPVELRVYHMQYSQILHEIHDTVVFSRLTRLLVHYGTSPTDAAENMRTLVAAAPKLKELAVYLFWDLPGDRLPRSLEAVLRSALQFSRIETLALHVICEPSTPSILESKGSVPSDESRFTHLLSKLRDRRVSIWWDERGLAFDTPQGDFVPGKGVWFESRPVPLGTACEKKKEF